MLLKEAYQQYPDPEVAAHLIELLWSVGREIEARDLMTAQLKTSPKTPCSSIRRCDSQYLSQSEAVMDIRGLLITLMMAIAMTGCIHQTRTIIPQPISTEFQVSLTEPWIAKGKLLVTTKGSKQSLRFNWRHNTAADDIITIGDTLGIRQLELHERNGVLFRRMSDDTLQPNETHQL